MSETSNIRTLGAIFYDDFELLDMYGPLEMFGTLGDAVRIETVAERAGPVRSTQGPESVAAHSFETAPPFDLLLLPGGEGTLSQLGNEAMLSFIVHDDLPPAAARELESMALIPALRPSVLYALLRKEISDTVSKQLQLFVDTGTRDEAVAATRALSGHRIAHLGALKRSKRKNRKDVDDLDNSFVSLGIPAVHDWAPRLDHARSLQAYTPTPFVVGDWTVDPLANVVFRGADRRSLQPKAMAVLLQLAKNPGTVVDKQELLSTVWRDRFVGDDAVHRRIADLRRVFDDSRKEPKFIETITTRGYRLIAEVQSR